METRNASRIESDHNFALSDQTSDLAGDCLFKKEKLFPALSLYYNVHHNITLLLGIFLDIYPNRSETCREYNNEIEFYHQFSKTKVWRNIQQIQERILIYSYLPQNT